MTARRRLLIVALALGALLAACGGDGAPAAGPTPTLDAVDRAAAQATALVQQAQATAIVLAAQVQATALVEEARLVGGTPTSAIQNHLVYATPTAPPAGLAAPSEEEGAAEETESFAEEDAAEPLPVQVTGVGFAADGGIILVRFLAPPEEAEKWWPGTVSLTDEGNGAVYNEIPVMPKVGPLIGRPKVAGQPGYVMLVNAPPYLSPGALVTIELGAHRFEHVPVE
jgi:hypothetical protein